MSKITISLLTASEKYQYLSEALESKLDIFYYDMIGNRHYIAAIKK